MILTTLRDTFLALSYKKYLAKCFSEGYELPYAAFEGNSLYICRRKQHFCAFLPYYEANKMTTTALSERTQITSDIGARAISSPSASCETLQNASR